MTWDFMQFSYVTNDFDQAVDRLRTLHDMGDFRQMREMHIPTGSGRAAFVNLGLAFKGELQFEVIQPLGEDSAIYAQSLSTDGFDMQFHHLGHHMASVDQYQKALERMKARWHVPIEMAEFGGYYAYGDGRPEVGHYLELFCFPDSTDPIEAPRY